MQVISYAFKPRLTIPPPPRLCTCEIDIISSKSEAFYVIAKLLTQSKSVTAFQTIQNMFFNMQIIRLVPPPTTPPPTTSLPPAE